jgi:S1-C subfamily serine protease
VTKAKSIPGLVLPAALLIWFGFTVSASAVSQDVKNASTNQLYVWTEECLQEASSSDNAAYQTKVLTWGLNHLQQALTHVGSNDQLNQAISDVQTTLDDVKNKEDSEKLKQDINQALQDVHPLISNEDGGADQSNSNGATPPAPPKTAETPPPVPSHPAVTVALTADQARAVVLIKGDHAEGTGFLVKTADGPAVVTNLHVISDNPNLKITTNTGQQITLLSLKGASDRDLAMFAIKDQNYSYLPLAADISGIAQPGDEVVTPGNSEGGEVMLNTKGKLLGIGPDRIEFDNPIYHGNSGGPVLHTKSGQVLGVVTEAMKVIHEDDLDKTSFASRNSAIAGSMRYFGFRIDTVPKWEPYDLQRFEDETALLGRFDKRNRCLDSYLNTPHDYKPDSILYRQDADIVKANASYFSQSDGGDTSQRLDALREWMGDLNSLADADMEAIQDANNFYSFDQQRAKDEIAYRKALKKELDEISNNTGLMSSLPRRN